MEEVSCLYVGMLPITLPDMNATTTLLEEIERFSQAQGIAMSTVGLRAVNDGKLADRLRRGGSVTLDTADRIREFMRSYVPEDTERPSKRANGPQHIAI